MSAGGDRSLAAWTYLLPETDGPLLVVGQVSQRLREDLAAAGIEAIYRETAADLDARGAHGLVGATGLDARVLGDAVAGLPAGAPVAILPSAAGRQPRRTAALLRQSGVEVKGVFAALPGAGTPRLLAPIAPGAVFRGALRLHTTTNARAAVLKRAAWAASYAGITSLVAPGVLAYGHRPGGHAASLIEMLRGDLGADGPPAILNPSAGRGVKGVARLAHGDGRAVAYAKMASPGVRADDLADEAAILEYLAASGPHPFDAPHVMATGERRGHRYVALSPLAEDGRVPDGRRTPALHDALIHLAGLGAAAPLTASSTWRDAEAGVRAQSDEASEVLSAALGRARVLAGETTLPLGVAHRDLAAWNVRLGPRIAILDWEWARRDALPFLDQFHYLLHTAVHVRGEPLEHATRALLASADGTSSWVREYGADIGLAEDLERVSLACFLLYLVDWYLLQRDRGTEADAESGASASPYVALLRTLLDDSSRMERTWLGR